MLLPDLSYHKPDSSEALFAVFDQIADRPLHLLAGGTDLIPALKRLGHLTHAPALISLNQVTHRHVTFIEQENILRIGAGVTLGNLTANPLILSYLPIVARVAQTIASPQIRNRATIGGNLLVDNRCSYFNQSTATRESHGNCFKAGGNQCSLIRSTQPGSPQCRARFVSDLAPILMVLGAKVIIVAPEGKKTVDVGTLYRADGMDHHNLAAGAFIAEIEIEIAPSRQTGYEKLRIRDVLDFPSLGVAVSKTATHRGRSLELALTGVDTVPRYQTLDYADFADEAELLEALENWARQAVSPLQQDFFPPTYRRKMIGVYLRKIVSQFH